MSSGDPFLKKGVERGKHGWAQSARRVLWPVALDGATGHAELMGKDAQSLVGKCMDIQ